jgi:CubicO group peptidase (beta-lactamase class C family)
MIGFRNNSRFGYCNTNYAMLALVIEKVTNLSYQDAMKNCFQTIRMTNTYVFDYEKRQINCNTIL